MAGSVATVGDPGSWLNCSGGVSGANSTFLTKYRTGNLDITGVSTGGIRATAGATVKTKMLVYNDTGGGVPGTLLAASNELTSLAQGYNVFTFGTPFSLARDTVYWIGYITDGAFNVAIGTGASTSSPPGSIGPRWGKSGTTYASGPVADLAGQSATWTGDSSVLVNQYLTGAYAVAVCGSPEFTPAQGTGNAGANASYVTQWTAVDSLSGVVAGHLRFAAAYPSAKIKMVVYAQGINKPGVIIATSNELVGVTLGFNEFTFATPFNIAAGTPYWIGYITDTSMSIWTVTGPGTSYWDTGTTYTSGPASPWTSVSEQANRLAGAYLENPPDMPAGASGWTATGATTDPSDHVIEDGSTGQHAISYAASDFDAVSRTDLSFTADLLDVTHDWVKIAIGDEWGFVNLRTGALGDCSAGFMLHGVT